MTKKILVVIILVFLSIVNIGCDKQENRWLVLSSFKGDILLNIDDALKGKLSIAKINDIISERKESHLDCLSRDGRYAWIRNKADIEIFDIRDKKTVALGEEAILNLYKNNAEEWRGQFSFYKTARYHETENLCKVRHFEKVIKVIYSPDNKFIAKVICDEQSNYCIDIVNIKDEKVVDKVLVGEAGEYLRNPLELNQWHKNGNLLFNFKNKAYKYNVKNKRKCCIGNNIYYPLITDDGMYMLYSKPEYDASEETLKTVENGIYIKNLKTNEIIEIARGKDVNIYGIKLFNFTLENLIYTKLNFHNQR